MAMTTWTSDEIQKIATAEELEVASLRGDGTLRKPTPIWVVRVGDALYVRSVNGATCRTSIFSIVCPIAVRFGKRLKVSTSGSSGMIHCVEQLSSRRRNYVHVYSPASPRPACDPRAGISSIPGTRRHEQVASAERIHWKGSPHGC